MTLTDGTYTVSLSGWLQWTDRGWAPVAQSVTRVFDGGLVVQSAPLSLGRPITLVSGSDSGYLSAVRPAPTTLSPLERLQAWAAVAGQTLTLAGLRGETATRSVIFRHQDGAIDLAPVDNDHDGHPAQYWRGTIRLMQIA